MSYHKIKNEMKGVSWNGSTVDNGDVLVKPTNVCSHLPDKTFTDLYVTISVQP